MNFENIPPKWDAAGTEPSKELQTNGFTAGYKPPAAYFNYLFNKITACLKELQSILGNRNLKTYITLEQLNLSEGSETIEDIIAAMPNFSLLHCATSSNNNMAIYPSEYGGTLIAEKSYGNRVKFTYFAQSKEWTGHYFNGVWYGWKLTFDEANTPTAEQVGALALDGTAANANKVNYTMLTDNTSILERALNLGVGTYEFSINGASYTGGDLPHSNYSYGRATIHKRAFNAITVVLWGFNISNALVPVFNQYGSNGWSGWKALALKEDVEKIPANNNILINSNFANPVNQRGQTSVTPTSGIVYWIDRWRAGTDGNGRLKYETVDGGVKITGASSDNWGMLNQHIEFPEKYLGKTLTIQSCVNNVVHSFTVTLPNTLQSTFWKQSDIYSDGTALAIGINGNQQLYVQIVSTTSEIIFQRVKLELGDHATPYVPRLYAEEWLLCQRYYKVFAPMRIATYAIGNTEFIDTIPIDMRVNPTVTLGINNVSNITKADVDSWANKKAVQIFIKKASSGHFDLNMDVTLDAEL